MSEAVLPHQNPAAALLRLVGDPIDVVTGAVIERTRDAWLPGVIPFAWYRYYDSSCAGDTGPLGWAHRHSYEYSLLFDLDGVRYLRPDGPPVGFPYPTRPGVPEVQGELALIRERTGLHVIQRLRDPAIEFGFEPGGRVARATSITWSGRNAIRLEYTEAGRLREIIDTRGARILLGYDGAGHIVELTIASDGALPAGRLLSYEYDPRGRLVRLMDPYGGTCSFAYDAGNRIVERRERSGYRIFYTFDAAGRCSSATGEDGVQRHQLAYAPELSQTTVIRVDGGRWVYTYDQAGLVTRLVDPYGTEYHYKYDDDGETREVFPEGERPFQGPPYEPAHRRPSDLLPKARHYPAILAMGLLSRFRPVCAAAYEYGSRLNFRNFRLPRADAPELSRLPANVRALVTTAALHPDDPLAAAADGGVYVGPGEWAAAWDYHDRFGTLIRRMTPSGANESWTYDSAGNVRVYTDPDGARWEYAYHSWNYLRQETDPLGLATRYEHSPTAQLASVTDPGQAVTDFRYDLKDRLVELRHADGTTDRLAYGASSAPVARSRGGFRAEWLRGGAGKVERIRYADGTESAFAYDERGRCVRAETTSGTVDLEFNAAGDLGADLRDDRGVRHVFDDRGTGSTEVLGRFVTRRTREEDGTVTIVDPTKRRHRVAILPSGVVTREFANGVGEVAQFDWAGRCLLKARFHRDGGGVVARRFEYSPAGDLQRVSAVGNDARQFSYDAAHRLVGQVAADGERAEFAYDAAGNLLRQPGLQDVVIGSANRLHAANGRTLAYDDRGCVTSVVGEGGSESLSYDAAMQLVGYERGAMQWRATYDGFGRRTRVRSTARDAEYWWDGERIIAEHTAGRYFRVYVYVDREALVPLLFVDYQSPDDEPETGRVHLVFTDHLGTARRIEDATGAVCWRSTSDPFGAMRIEAGGTVEFALRFPGHYFDPETGLHYNRHRYYDPLLGRYLQPDPLDITGGLNVYAYTPRPTCEVDVDGLACPLKPIGPNDEEGDDYRQRAQDLADELQQRMGGAAATTTYAVFVIDDGGQRRLVVVSNRDNPPPAWVVAAAAAHGAEFIPTQAAPPNVATERQNPRTGEWQPTNGHAEQRGLSWADANSTANGGTVRSVNAISPTQGCCPGCNDAIEGRGQSTSSMVAPPNPRTPRLQRGEGALGYDPQDDPD